MPEVSRPSGKGPSSGYIFLSKIRPLCCTRATKFSTKTRQKSSVSSGSLWGV